MKPVTSAQFRKQRKAKTGTSIARRAAKRDIAEPEIRAALEAFGMSVFSLNEPIDLLVGFRGKTHLVEVKTGHKGYAKALNDNQQAFANEWRGSAVVTLHSRDEAIAWAQQTSRGQP
ncbi:hypothetical protein GGQ73_003036 [Rhizobium skierniewicense]|uniref:VRR-NUC domain-containing protein n=1 Tax=Rhizobium skierniewicense TaxID=984260 RepID=A0A7W6CC27_9HYPH|nr:hypothetical protein [Rhizobium skierniewicense]MBB3947072.1 hypothetical protein [Rhizobium skierniewicense]